jgi:photoactive yellow protein
MQIPELSSVLFALFDSMPVGVIILDVNGRVLFFNRYEEELARRKRANVLGRDFFHEVAPCMNVKSLGGAFRERVADGKLDTDVDFSFAFPFLEQPRDVRIRLRSLVAGGQTYGALLVEDVSLLRTVERMKESLSSLLVHDMKNPLAAMLANLEFLRLKTDTTKTPDAFEAIEESMIAARRLEAMLLDMLDMSRLETGSFPLRRLAVDLSALVRDAHHGNLAVARLRGIELVTDGAREVLRAVIDESVVRRCIDNLIDNALRYAKSRVFVRADEDDLAFVVEVGDDGAGVPDALKPLIFEKYGRGNEAATMRNRGLGLSFVQLATRAHGGDATVHDGANGGAVFRLRFAKSASAAAGVANESAPPSLEDGAPGAAAVAGARDANDAKDTKDAS